MLGIRAVGVVRIETPAASDSLSLLRYENQRTCIGLRGLGGSEGGH